MFFFFFGLRSLNFLSVVKTEKITFLEGYGSRQIAFLTQNPS
jgi:hypothetical protein